MSLCNKQGERLTAQEPNKLPAEIFEQVKANRVSLKSFAAFCLHEMCQWPIVEIGRVIDRPFDETSDRIESARRNLKKAMRPYLNLGPNREYQPEGESETDE